VVARPPVYGANLKSVDDADALKVPGVVKVVTIEGADPPAGFEPLGGVAVVAENTWAAIEGRRALSIEWNLEAAGDNAHYDTEAYRKALVESAQSPGKTIRESGNIEEALQKRTGAWKRPITCPIWPRRPWSRR